LQTFEGHRAVVSNVHDSQAFASIKLNIDKGATIKIMPASTRGLSRHAKFIDGKNTNTKQVFLVGLSNYIGA